MEEERDARQTVTREVKKAAVKPKLGDAINLGKEEESYDPGGCGSCWSNFSVGWALEAGDSGTRLPTECLWGR